MSDDEDEGCSNCGDPGVEEVTVSGGDVVDNGQYLACPNCGVFEKMIEE